MPEDILVWPAALLTPLSSPFQLRPFTRSGGRSLGGITRATRTDKGFWTGSYDGIAFRRVTRSRQWRVWNALRTALGGMAGLVAVPVCSSALWAAPGFSEFTAAEVPHDDDAAFDDDSEYSSGTISIKTAALAPLGSSVVTLELVNAPTASGIRFSYQHAMYETGRVLAEPAADTYQVEIFPAIRREIPSGMPLEADRPTCLCRLASDAEMDISFAASGMPRPQVNFVEAVDYWNALALEDAA